MDGTQGPGNTDRLSVLLAAQRDTGRIQSLLWGADTVIAQEYDLIGSNEDLVEHLWAALDCMEDVAQRLTDALERRELK